MRGRLILSRDGVEIRNIWRAKRFTWRDVLVFRVREYTARQLPSSAFFFRPRASVWLVTRAHEWHRIVGVSAEDQVHRLNEAMEEGRRDGYVDMSRFSGPEWRSMVDTDLN